MRQTSSRLWIHLGIILGILVQAHAAPAPVSATAPQSAVAIPIGNVRNMMGCGDVGYVLTNDVLYRYRNSSSMNWESVADCSHVFKFGEGIAGSTAKSVLLIGGETRDAEVVPALWRWDDPQAEPVKVCSLPSSVCAFSENDAVGVCADKNAVIVTQDEGKIWAKPAKIFDTGEFGSKIDSLQWLTREDCLVANTDGQVARIQITLGDVKVL